MKRTDINVENERDFQGFGSKSQRKGAGRVEVQRKEEFPGR